MIVVNSSFSPIYGVISSIEERINSGQFITRFVIWILSLIIRSLSKFSLLILIQLNHVLSLTMSVIIAHSCEDEVIPFNQGVEIYLIYNWEDKEFITSTVDIPLKEMYIFFPQNLRRY